MAVLESLAVALGTGIAKYIVKEVLPSDLQDQISEEMVDWGLGFLTQKRRESDSVATLIGKRVEALYRHSTIEENGKTAVLLEVTRILAIVDTRPTHLVELGLDTDNLFHELIELRQEAMVNFSQDEKALYERMLREASEGIIKVSGESIGFLGAVSRGILRGQGDLAEEFDRLEGMQTKLWSGLERLLAEPEEKTNAAEAKYRQHLIERLDRMEPFGIPQRDEIGQRLKLQDAFVKLKLTSRSDHKDFANILRHWRNKVTHHSSVQQDFFEGLDQINDDSINDRRIRQWITSFTGSATLNGVIESLKLLIAPSLGDSEFLDEVLAQERRVMIEGLAGSGKSTILQWMAVKAAQRNFPTPMAEWNGLVPFFIRLRQCREGGFPAPEKWPQLEAKQVAGLLPSGWVHDLLETGRAIVLVDGVDEMPQSQRNEMLKELRSLIHDYPLARYVVTSRPTAISEKQWPEWRMWLREAGFVETGVKELEGEQLDLFVDQWHEALERCLSGEDTISKVKRNAINLKHLLRRRTDLRKLATTPLLGAMICALYQDREDKVPRERLKLYEECVEMLLERREEKKGVSLDADYVDLSYSQKLVLLQALAYWMLDNTYSAASVLDVESQFTDRLPALDLRSVSGQDVRRLFVERAGLLQEAIVDEISFRHRTFQEFLAAKEAIKNNNLGVLIKNARDDQWRETIILAVGIARPDERVKLLQGILKRAASLKTVKLRHQIFLLALACLETCIELDPSIRQEVVFAAHSVFPPHSPDEVDQIAKAGDYAVDLLPYDPDYPTEIAILCIQTLAEIGGEAALTQLANYRQDERYGVQSALDSVWSRFEAEAFVNKIILDKDKITISGAPPHENWWELIPGVTHLDLHRLTISDLSLLEKLPNLTQLSLSGENVSDLSPLAKLSNLSRLSLTGKNIRDLSPLAKLPNISYLSLDGTGINDLSSLSNLFSLTELVLEGENIRDLSPLANLSRLTKLSLSGEGIGNLSLLAGLPLTYLSVGGWASFDANNQLSGLHLYGGTAGIDLSALSGLTDLSHLILSQLDDDLFRLPMLPSLSVLVLNGHHISSLAPLTNLPTLSQLYIWGGLNTGDISPLSELSKLSVLSLNSVNVKDFSPLVGLSDLSLLSIYGKSSTGNLYPLANLSNITELFLNGDDISDLSPLASLSNLSKLSLSGNGISDLSPLAGLTNLSQLSLSGNNVSDLSPLANLTNLSELSLSGNSISDLSPLADLPNLSQLSLGGKGISDLSPLASISALAHLGVGGTIYVDEKRHVIHFSPMEPTSVKNLRPILMQLTLRSLGLHDTTQVPNLAEIKRERGLAIYGGKGLRRQLYRYIPPTKSA